MARPTLAHFVPGDFTRPNSRRTELDLRWGTEADGRTLYLREYLDHEDDAFQEHLCGYLPLAELPEAPLVETLDDLERALAARFAAHPLANQLPPTLRLVEQALPAVEPLELVRVCARYLCIGGVARGFGAALTGAGGGPFRTQVEPVELRRLARACLVLELGTLDCHKSWGNWTRSTRELFEELPTYPEGKHASHDGGQHDAVCREYDRLLVEYLRAAAQLMERALTLPAQKLDARCRSLWLPSGVWTADEALGKLTESLQKKSGAWEINLRYALHELHGQPFAQVAPLIGKLLSGESPVPLPEGSTFDAERVAEGHMVTGLLAALVMTDLDLAAEVREAVAKKQAEAAELAAWAEENRRNAPPPSARPGIALGMFLLDDKVFPFVLLAGLAAIALGIGMCLKR